MKKVEDLALKAQKETRELLEDVVKQIGGIDTLLGQKTEDLALAHKSMILMSTFMDLGVEEAKELVSLNEKLDIIIEKIGKLEK